MDMQSKRGKAFSVVTSAALVASLGLPAMAVADESDQTASSQETTYQRTNVVDELLETENQESTGTTVATVGENSYATVNEAITAAADGATITLTADVIEDVVVPAGKNITLDLAGHTITNNTSDTITVAYGATLVVTGEGTVDNKTHAKAAVYNSGTVSLKGGTYDRTAESGQSANISGDNTWYTICNHGVMTVSDGVTVKNSGGFSSMFENGYYSYNAGNERSGYVEGQNAANPTLTIEGGTFTGGLNAVKNDDGAILTINGGTFSNTSQAAVLSWNVATINGGSFTVSAGASTCLLNGAYEATHSDIDQGSLTVTGGTFTAPEGTVCITNNFTDVTPSVTGGTFSSDPSAFVASGYVVSESNGAYTVSQYVAPTPDPDPTPTPDPDPEPETDVEELPDGSTVTTVTQPDGSQTVTTEAADGTTSTVEKDAEGTVTSTEVAVSEQAAAAGAVVLPLDAATPASDAASAAEVTVSVPETVSADAPVQVTVPVATDEAAGVNYGVVVYAVDAEGNETVLPKCGVDADGNAVFEATGDVTIKVVDASASFPDTEGQWYGDDGVADFVSARGILTGMPQDDGTLAFDGDTDSTRAMFVTMLYRAESTPEVADAGFEDASGMWYETAASWGASSGIVVGYSGLTFGGDDTVTREQMAMFLMRYADSLGLDTSARADLSEFSDADETSSWTSEAMSWAVAEGLFVGYDGQLAPGDGATRAEASAVIMRFINGMYA